MIEETLYYTRERLWDISDKVAWLNDGQSMYEDPEVVARYDVSNLECMISTFRSSSDLEFIDMCKHFKFRSVLDLGCGAGAFFHLLKAEFGDIEYVGYDASVAQITRAKELAGEAVFAVRDISEISVEEFSRFDAIHSYSVFSFMSVEKQLSTLRRIVESGSRFILMTGTTRAELRYCPQHIFRSFSARLHGKPVLTAVAFPFDRELEAAVSSTDSHTVTFEDKPFENSRLLNASGRDGGALDTRRFKTDKLWRRLPFGRTVRLRWAHIAPREWISARRQDYSLMTEKEVYAHVSAILRARKT